MGDVVGWYCKNSANAKKEGMRMGCVIALGVGMILGVCMAVIVMGVWFSE